MSSPILLQHLQDAINNNDIAYVSDNIHILPINAPLTPNNETAMHLCALGNQADMMSLLLQQGALVNCRDVFGHTPLHSACSAGAAEAAHLLTKSGAAAIDMTSKRGMTPLMIAVWHRRLNIVRMLLASGALLQAVSKDGAQALHYAALTGDADIFTTLLAKHKNQQATVGGLQWQDIVRLQGEHLELLEYSSAGSEHDEDAQLDTNIDLVHADDGMPHLLFTDTKSHATTGTQNAQLITTPDSDAGNWATDDTLEGEPMALDTTEERPAPDTTGAVTGAHQASITDPAGTATTTKQATGATGAVIAVTGEGVAVTGNMLTVNETAASETGEHIASATAAHTALSEEEQYSFDQSQLQEEINHYTEQHKATDAETQQQQTTTIHETQETQVDPITPEHTVSDAEIPAYLVSDDFAHTDTFDVSQGLFRSVSGMYTNNMTVLTISNLLAALDIPHEIDRSMQGTVTPGEQTPTFSFFDRNGNVVVWEVLEYDPFESDNISRWNKTKLWFQNNGFSYDINFFMSHASSDAIDSKELYAIAQTIKQQM